jgi:hypothetical protein
MSPYYNTMSNAPFVWFGWNQRWGRVIGGDLLMKIKSFFLHTPIIWALADYFAFGASTPKPLDGASSQHHGQCAHMVV